LALILDNIKTTHGETHPCPPPLEATLRRRRGICSDEIETVILKYNRTRTKILPYQHIPTSAWASRSKQEGAPRSWPARESNPSDPKSKQESLSQNAVPNRKPSRATPMRFTFSAVANPETIAK